MSDLPARLTADLPAAMRARDDARVAARLRQEAAILAAYLPG